MISSITVRGQEGVWRLLHSEIHTSHQEVLGKMEEDLWNIQPESHGYNYFDGVAMWLVVVLRRDGR